jgi:putative transposase
MTQAYDPYENAVAERVNGILKDEFAIGDGFITFSQAHREIKYVIQTYNSKRPHLSCNFLTPINAHRFGKYKLRSWSRLSTNKHILTKEKRSKKENLITNNATFN